MPIICFLLGGHGSENTKKTVEGVTEFEDLSVPNEAVGIVMYEVPEGNWATVGSLSLQAYVPSTIFLSTLQNG